jgi:PD-(D/E)XK nuclease superfamily
MNFLQRSANYIFQKNERNALQRICVVLPSRRAVFYFKKALAECSETPFIAPEVFAIDDFVMKLSGVKPIDSISLILELYTIFKKFDAATDFDRFVAWGTTLLKDFDSIDQYLIDDPREIFAYMSDAKAIARWGFELDKIGKSIEATQKIEAYFKLFENIYAAYQELQKRLNAKELAYRGMAYRMLATEMDTFLIENETYDFFYFVGLNALSRSEERIVEKLVKAKIAETLWDSDDFYMKGDHKAGNVLRQYKFTGKFGEWNWQTNDLLTSEKQIRVFGVANNTLQAKLAGEIYANALAERPKEQAVMVLADEQMLVPLMYSLDESIQDFNITMGLSLKSSLLATMIETLFELQLTIVEFKGKTGETFKIPKYSHRHIHKLLNHPFIRRYELLKYEGTEAQNETESNPIRQNPIREALRTITKNNSVYLSEQEMIELGQNDPIFKILFRRWNNKPERAFESFYELIDALREVYKTAPDAIEIEYLYLFLTILNRLESIFSNFKQLNIKNLRHFLNELIRQEKIPFSGEPVADLQIMSMLETRCLDFDHVIILSLNEGKLPSSTRNNSLIPFDACIEFGLPVYHEQDAIMAYHFFRLMQRAKTIDLLYEQPSGSGVGGGNEPSRFILQVEHDLLKANPKITYTKPVLDFKKNEENEIENEISVVKSAEILAKTKKIISEKGLYPSHLNMYLECPLKYYFTKIADLSKREEVDENLGADIFGNWIHKTLEKIDEDYTSTTTFISKEDIEKIITEIPSRLQNVYETDFAGIVIDRGINYVLHHIAEKVLIDFFEEQRATQTFPFEVLDVEKLLITTFDMPYNDEQLSVKIAGRVDRIERHNNVLKVVDYKTGMVTQTDILLGKKTLREKILEEKAPKVIQLWMYQYLMLKKIHETKDFYLGNQLIENQEVIAKIYSFRNLKTNLEVNLRFENQTTPFQFIEESEKVLAEIVGDILSPETTFNQTTDHALCGYCDFKGICGR